MINKDVNKTLKSLPMLPGVYLFKDSLGKILYVGKAINLKNRVSSYFSLYQELSPKSQSLISRIYKIDYILVENEVEALVLEADLIKKFKPKYNISLKDDKNYSFLSFSQVKRAEVTLSYILFSKKNNDNSTLYLGPFPDGALLKKVIRNLRKLYPFADCSNSKYLYYKKLKKPCLYGKIGLCLAPCQNTNYAKFNNSNVLKIEKLIKLKKGKITSSLKNEMALYAKNQEYEKASKIRDLLVSLDYLYKAKSFSNDYITNPLIKSEKTEKALRELQNILGLSIKPKRIEIYDISNISGKHAVGSMVVLTNGEIDKAEYRKFKVKSKSTPDDLLMLDEIIARRFKNTWDTPDLLVIDGGKGQVSSVLKALTKLSLEIPVIGLAKKFETIVLPNFTEIKLSKDSLALNLLIKGRNEAHRFAITYHKTLREKNIVGMIK